MKVIKHVTVYKVPVPFGLLRIRYKTYTILQMIKLFSILSLFITNTIAAQTFKTLSIEEQLQDIEFIKTELQNLHPGIYTYQSEDEFEDGFQSLKGHLEQFSISTIFWCQQSIK